MAWILVVATACLAVPMPAHAYLEPGTTASFLQIIVGAAVAALFAVKLYYRRLIGFFQHTSEPDASSPTDERQAASNE